VRDRREPLGEPSKHDHPVDPDRVARARAGGISADDAARLASTLSLLADPVRARILYALDLVEELCVGDIALALRTSEDSVGYALRLLYRWSRHQPQGRPGGVLPARRGLPTATA
jgi:ArsR family transcriptional regulator, lead/cadmium/zinc/bismuth-responsive transcriptional repressor